MFSWQMYADENYDVVLPGYSSRVEAWDDRGNPLGSPIRDRYPWRLAPHLSHSFRGIYVNESRHFLDEAESMSHGDFVYRASLYPSLGYNSVFLGGDDQKFNPGLAAANFGTDWLVTRAAQIQRPSELLAFASARSRSGYSPDEPGYFVVYPPCIRSRQWEAEFQAASAPEDWGYVHPRWNRRAVVALTDGHTETMTDAELQWFVGAKPAVSHPTRTARVDAGVIAERAEYGTRRPVARSGIMRIHPAFDAGGGIVDQQSRSKKRDELFGRIERHRIHA